MGNKKTTKLPIKEGTIRKLKEETLNFTLSKREANYLVNKINSLC